MFRNPKSTLKKFRNHKFNLQKFCKPQFNLRKFHKPQFTLRTTCEKFLKLVYLANALRKFRNSKHLANTLQKLRGFANLFRNPKTEFQQPCEFQKSPVKLLFKGNQPCFHFAFPSEPYETSLPPCEAQATCGQPFEETNDTSCSISATARIRGGHTDPSVSCEQRPRASPLPDSSQAPKAQTILSSEGGVPSSPLQRRYAMRRPPMFPPSEPSVRRVPPKRARTSGLAESSRHPQPDPRAPIDSQIPSGLGPETIIKRPMVTVPLIEGNSDCRTRYFHSKLYFDIEVL